MNGTTINATRLKYEISDVLNTVCFKNEPVIVERYGKPMAKIIPFHFKCDERLNTASLLDCYFGCLPDFPEVVKNRKFRKRNIKL